MSNRFKDGSTFLESFATHFFVHCPKCQKMAIVAASPDETITRISCSNCGYVKDWSCTQAGVRMFSNNAENYKNGVLGIGANTDWCFHFPLWLNVACCGEELWAYNLEHLSWMKSYIGASLRERQESQQTGWSNASLESRLPKWLKLSKNRNEILKGIEYLEKKIQITANKSNFGFNGDKHPADYCVIFYGSEVISVFNFVVGACALSG